MKQLIAVSLTLTALVMAGCSQQTALFNGQNLDGWTTYLKDQNVHPDDVWSVSDGVLRCEGVPTGYIRTEDSYSDYILELQWRWPAEPTNSGVLLHATGRDKVWPQCIEAQLQHENAGDIVMIQQGSTVTVDGLRYRPQPGNIFAMVPRQNPSSERPAGQWNDYKIICRGDTVELYVNGQLQNRATDARPSRGYIALQSEGSPVEFRDIVLTKIDTQNIQ